MKTQREETSPQTYARMAGICYLVIIVAGALGQIFIRGALVAPGDAATTAANILNAQSLWRLGIFGDILMHILDIPVMLALYVLLKPVNKNLVLLAVLFNIIQTATLVVNKSNLVMPLLILENGDSFKAFEFIQLHDYGFGIGLIFFGFACLLYGYLIFKSSYLPKILGVLMMIAGASYLTNSATLLLAPAYSGNIFPVLLLALIGELSLSLWLIVKGVNLSQWKNARWNWHKFGSF